MPDRKWRKNAQTIIEGKKRLATTFLFVVGIDKHRFVTG
jgi:hypothetical protein